MEAYIDTRILDQTFLVYTQVDQQHPINWYVRFLNIKQDSVLKVTGNLNFRF